MYVASLNLLRGTIFTSLPPEICSPSNAPTFCCVGGFVVPSSSQREIPTSPLLLDNSFFSPFSLFSCNFVRSDPCHTSALLVGFLAVLLPQHFCNDFAAMVSYFSTAICLPIFFVHLTYNPNYFIESSPRSFRTAQSSDDSFLSPRCSSTLFNIPPLLFPALAF